MAEEARRAENFAALDDLGRASWRAWTRVRGQVSMLNQNVTKAEHCVVILDAQAVIWSMEAEGIPMPLQAQAWDDIMALHDVSYHGAENLMRACIGHLMADGPLMDLTCRRCLRSVGAEDLVGCADG